MEFIFKEKNIFLIIFIFYLKKIEVKSQLLCIDNILPCNFSLSQINKILFYFNFLKLLKIKIYLYIYNIKI